MRLSAEKETRRERPKSAPYLRLKNIQGTTIGNIWKKFFFKKIIFEIFFEKKYFLSRTMPKISKRGHSGSFNVFYKPKTSKKCKGVPFDKIRKFSKKSRIVPKKTQRGDPLVSPVLLEALKSLWFSARIEPTLAGLVEDGR